jgi:hypothetical protein
MDKQAIHLGGRRTHTIEHVHSHLEQEMEGLVSPIATKSADKLPQGMMEGLISYCALVHCEAIVDKSFCDGFFRLQLDRMGSCGCTTAWWSLQFALLPTNEMLLIRP